MTDIRTLLDDLQKIQESTGLAGRAPGAKFTNPSGDTIEFVKLEFAPANGGTLDKQQMDTALSEVQKLNVKWINNRTSKSGGFGIAEFTDVSGEPLYIGKYFDKIHANLKNNYIPNNVFDYQLDTAASKKTKEPLKPQDLLTELSNLSIADIMKQLANSLGTNNPLYELAHKIAIGQSLPITISAPQNTTFSGFRDYFCEILQPMALQQGQYTGNAGEAAKRFLGGTMKDTEITFDASVTAGLSDSVLTKSDGRQLLISTKGGKGAKASARNLMDKIEILRETADGRKFLSSYEDEIELIENIVKAGQNGAPLYLGVKFGIITPQDAEQVRNLRNKEPIDITNQQNVDNLPISQQLIDMIRKRKTKNPNSVDLYYHLMAEIAELAANKVNTSTNFSDAATNILNNSALVQVYTTATNNGTTWTLSEFKTVWPSDLIKGVELDSGKTYYSTDIKGNFTFAIDAGDGRKQTSNETSSNNSDNTGSYAIQRNVRKTPKKMRALR